MLQTRIHWVTSAQINHKLPKVIMHVVNLLEFRYSTCGVLKYFPRANIEKAMSALIVHKYISSKKIYVLWISTKN